MQPRLDLQAGASSCSGPNPHHYCACAKYSSSSLMFNGGLHPRASQYRHLLDYSPDVTQVISSSLFSSYSLQCTNFSFPVPLTLPFSHRNVYLSEGERGRKIIIIKKKKKKKKYIYIFFFNKIQPQAVKFFALNQFL